MFVARDICLAASLFPMILFLALSGIGAYLLPVIWVLAAFLLPMQLVIAMIVCGVIVKPTLDSIIIAPLAMIGYLGARKFQKRTFLPLFLANMLPYMGLFVFWGWPLIFGVAVSEGLESYGMIVVMLTTTILTVFAAGVVALALSIPLAILQVKVLKIIESRIR